MVAVGIYTFVVTAILALVLEKTMSFSLHTAEPVVPTEGTQLPNVPLNVAASRSTMEIFKPRV